MTEAGEERGERNLAYSKASEAAFFLEGKILQDGIQLPTQVSSSGIKEACASRNESVGYADEGKQAESLEI